MKLRDLEKLELEADRALYEEDPELAREMGYAPPVFGLCVCRHESRQHAQNDYGDCGVCGCSSYTPDNPYYALLNGTAQQGAAQQKASSWIFSALNAAGSVMGGIPGVWPRI